jgi:hypothetical protein
MNIHRKQAIVLLAISALGSEAAIADSWVVRGRVGRVFVDYDACFPLDSEANPPSAVASAIDKLTEAQLVLWGPRISKLLPPGASAKISDRGCDPVNNAPVVRLCARDDCTRLLGTVLWSADGRSDLGETFRAVASTLSVPEAKREAALHVRRISIFSLRIAAPAAEVRTRLTAARFVPDVFFESSCSPCAQRLVDYLHGEAGHTLLGKYVDRVAALDDARKLLRETGLKSSVVSRSAGAR